jgi:PAS domain S-box-containing protein
MVHILYLDDEPAILDIGKEYLESDGEMTVDITTSAEDALSRLSLVPYDAILSDYLMPDIDGIEFLKRVRNTHPKIPFIIFSGKASMDVVIDAINNGADFFLEKDLDNPVRRFFELCQLIRQGAARYHAEQRLLENEEIFRTVADNSSDWDYWISPTSTIIYMSSSCEQISGYTREEFIKNPHFLSDIISPLDKQVWDTHISHKNTDDNTITIDIRIIHKDGTNRWISHACLPIYDENRVYRGRRVRNRDITEKILLEQQLRESEESFRSIFDNQQPMLIVDATSHLISNVNDEAAHLIGLPKQDIIGKICHKFICPADIGKCPIGDLNQKVDHSERILLNHVQKQIPVIKTVKPVTIHGKEYLIESFVDITERKSRLEELQFTNTMLTTLNESSTSGILVIDQQGEINTYNQNLISILGIEEDIVKSGTEQEIHESLAARSTAPEEFLNFVARLADNQSETGQLDISLISGKFLSLYSAPMIAKDNTLYGRVWYYRDITTHTLNQDAILHLSKENQIILDNVPAMIWYKDTKNNFIRVNKKGAESFGMQIADIEGKSTYDLFPDYADHYFADDMEVITSKKPKYAIIEPMTMVNGETRWVKTDKIPLFNDQGDVSGIIVFVIDITEQQKNEQALRTSNKKLHLLSDITRHDILNQIQVLLFYIDEIEHTSHDSQDQQKIDKINVAVRNIERQITFTRDYQDIGMSSPIWQDIKTTIIKALRSLQIEPIVANIDIGDVQIFADPLLGKVFYNIIDNAKRYGETITQISFSAHMASNGLVISIEDDGVGIPVDKKKRIFNREYYHNTGFGLNLSREILEITGITIEEHGKPGKGAMFEILVPEGSYLIK